APYQVRDAGAPAAKSPPFPDDGPMRLSENRRAGASGPVAGATLRQRRLDARRRQAEAVPPPTTQSGRQDRAARGATCLRDAAAGFGRHAGAKAVAARTNEVRGLESAFHRSQAPVPGARRVWATDPRRRASDAKSA